MWVQRPRTPSAHASRASARVERDLLPGCRARRCTRAAPAGLSRVSMGSSRIDGRPRRVPQDLVGQSDRCRRSRAAGARRRSAKKSALMSSLLPRECSATNAIVRRSAARRCSRCARRVAACSSMQPARDRPAAERGERRGDVVAPLAQLREARLERVRVSRRCRSRSSLALRAVERRALALAQRADRRAARAGRACPRGRRPRGDAGSSPGGPRRRRSRAACCRPRRARARAWSAPRPASRSQRAREMRPPRCARDGFPRWKSASLA